MNHHTKPFVCHSKWAGFLQGHVKTARVSRYSVKYIEGLPIKSVVQHVIETFDQEGHHLKTYEYDKNGALKGEETYIYSDKGLLMEIIFTKAGKITRHDIYEYNSNNQRIRTSSYGENDSFCGFEYFVYDENGNLIERRWESQTPEYRRKWTHKYDDRGNCINSQYFKGSNYVFSHELCDSYDDNGIRLERRIVHNNGKIEIEKPERDMNGNIVHSERNGYRLETEKRYDKANNIIEQKIFDFQGERYTKNTIKYFYSFDNSKERTITLDRNGNVESMSEHTYDANHNLLCTIRYRSELNTITDIYENEYLYYSYQELTGEKLDSRALKSS